MPAPQQLPNHPNLVNLRKRAKTLLIGWRAGQPTALARIAAWHPRARQLHETGSSALADAQLVVAREYGFGSWPSLVHHLRLEPQAQALHLMDRQFQATLPPIGGTATVGEVLGRRVELLRRGHRDGDPAAAGLLRAVGGARGYDEIQRTGLTLPRARAAVAREHGFAGWDAAMVYRDEPVDPRFEAAVEALVSGELDALRTLLDTDPALVTARSPFGHHATLVHYVAANGIELSRQWQTPPNAAPILRTLLARGADPDALCDTYGGGGAQTPLCLLVSSRHPADAGVQASLVEVLCRGGASPDGLDDDGLPLWTAITWGYSPAVEALARCGARVDNVVFAAALGDLPAVRRHFDGDGYAASNPARSGQRVGAHGPHLDPHHLTEYALIYAAGHNRRPVVEFLLGRNPDLDVSEPVFHSTALGAARYHGFTEIVALLEAT